MNQELKTNLEEAASIGEILFESQFQLSDIGLTSKVAFDWSKGGMYLRERKSKYRRSYNGLEYIWLMLVKELREFGLPIKSIQNLKEYLLTEIDLAEYLGTIFENELSIEENKEEFLNEFKNIFNSSEKIETIVNDVKVNLFHTRLSIIVFSSIMAKSDTHLLINKNGDCLVYDESPMEDRFVSSHILNTPYISFPLNHIITKFIGREHLYELDMTPNALELTEDEKRVLTLIRKGNISTLSVKFKSDRIDLIEPNSVINSWTQSLVITLNLCHEFTSKKMESKREGRDSSLC